MAQIINISSKCEALSSNSNNTTKKFSFSLLFAHYILCVVFLPSSR
jgi:hypothetical protein